MRNPLRADRPIPAWGYLLLAIPFVAVLWVPFYNSATPDLAGIPFFYWYQMLWIVITAVLTAIVYFATRPEGLPPADRPVDNVRRLRND